MATIRDIAKKAGVSPGAVSRILNNDTTLHVSAETRKKVLNTAKNLNYKKFPRANTPAAKNTFTMGIVLWFSAEEELKDNYYLKARQGVEDFCEKNNINVLVQESRDILEYNGKGCTLQHPFHFLCI